MNIMYLMASLVAQLVKNPPAMWKTWVQSLEEGMATHSSILAWRILMDRGAWQATVHRVTKGRTRQGTHAMLLKKKTVSSYINDIMFIQRTFLVIWSFNLDCRVRFCYRTVWID